MIGVLLCDDAVAFSVLFEHWVGEAYDLEIRGTAATPDDALRLAGERHPQVIVLDHLLQSTTSDQLASRLRAAAPDAGILLISGMLPADLAQAAERSGADGFISKASSHEAIREAIRAVAASGARPA